MDALTQRLLDSTGPTSRAQFPIMSSVDEETHPDLTTLSRPRCSRGNVLASRSRVRGFKPD